MSHTKSKHSGVTVRDEAGEIVGVVDEPHDEADCESACEDALQKVLGHETAYEAPDARETRKTSAGYSRAYAAKYSDIDWSN